MSRILRFLSELRRRKVLRVVGLYAVAGWVVIQAAATLAPLLLLPDWIARAVALLVLLGFPLALVLAWAFDTTPEGIRRAEQRLPVAAGFPRGILWASGGVAIVLAGAGMYAYTGGMDGSGSATWHSAAGLQGAGAEATPAESREALAILPFSVEGNSELGYLGTGMVKLLAAKLDGLTGLRSVDSNAVLNHLREEPGAVGPERCRAVAERFGAGLYVLGSVIEGGGRIHLEAALYDAGIGSDPVVRASVEGAAADILALVDELAGRLLAERLERSGAQLARSAALTTRSLPALQAYLEGERLLRELNPTVAVAAFQRAVDLDSTFALAWYRLQTAASWGNEFLPLRRTALPTALRHAGRLSPLDRGLVEAYAAYARGDWDRAEAAYRQLIGQYPDNVEAWKWLGETLYHGNAFRGRSRMEAWEPLLNAAELDPGNVAVAVHPAMLALRAGRYALADSLMGSEATAGGTHVSFGRLARLSAEGPSALNSVLQGLDAAPEQHRFHIAGILIFEVGVPVPLMDSIAARFPRQHAGNWRWAREVVALERGRWRQVDADLASDPRSLLYPRGWYAASPAFRVPVEDVERVFRDIRSFPAPSGAADWPSADNPVAGLEPEIRQYLLGLLSLRMGDTRGTDESATALERAAVSGVPHASVLRHLAAELRARLARDRGNAAGALRLLEEAEREPIAKDEYVYGDPFVGLTHARWLRAELLAELGRDSEALGWFETFIGQSDYGDHIYRPLAHLRRAGILERLGEHERARPEYSRFLELWDDGDPHLRPLVEAARLRLRELAAGQPTSGEGAVQP